MARPVLSFQWSTIATSCSPSCHAFNHNAAQPQRRTKPASTTLACNANPCNHHRWIQLHRARALRLRRVNLDVGLALQSHIAEPVSHLRRRPAAQLCQCAVPLYECSLPGPAKSSPRLCFRTSANSSSRKPATPSSPQTTITPDDHHRPRRPSPPQTTITAPDASAVQATHRRPGNVEAHGNLVGARQRTWRFWIAESGGVQCD